MDQRPKLKDKTHKILGWTQGKIFMTLNLARFLVEPLSCLLATLVCPSPMFSHPLSRSHIFPHPTPTLCTLKSLVWGRPFYSLVKQTVVIDTQLPPVSLPLWPPAPAVRPHAHRFIHSLNSSVPCVPCVLGTVLTPSHHLPLSPSLASVPSSVHLS